MWLSHEAITVKYTVYKHYIPTKQWIHRALQKKYLQSMHTKSENSNILHTHTRRYP